MGKSQKTKLARKRAKRKKIIIWVVSITAIVAIAVAVTLYIVNQQDSRRVYVSDDQTITLNDDGTFEAVLYHGLNISGTYTESTEGSVVIITYFHDGITATGSLSGNVLNIPDEWQDDHGHSYNFTLK